MSSPHGHSIKYVSNSQRSLLRIPYYVFCTLVYGVTVAIYFVLPLGSDWGRKLIGTSIWGPDNILCAAILEWGWRSLRTHLHVFDWVTGYPMSNSLAGTENLLGWQLLYTPLRAMGTGTVAAMNALVCLSFVVSGVGTAALARRHGLPRPAALCAGFIFAFAAPHTFNLIQFSSLAVCWLPWALLFLDRFSLRGMWADGAAAVALICVTVLSGMYIGIFLVIVAALDVSCRYCLGSAAVTRRSAGRLLAVFVLAASLLAPVLARYVRFNSDHGLTKSLSYMSANSVGVLKLFEPVNFLAVWSRVSNSQSGAFVGFSVLGLGLLGMWKGPFNLNWKLQHLIVCGVLVVLACGPYLIIYKTPVLLAGHHVPMPGWMLILLPGVRMPFRLLLPALLFASAICGASVAALVSRFGNKASAVVMLLLFAELYPVRSLTAQSVALPPPSAMAQAYSHLDGCSAVAELPVPEPENGPHELLSRYVYAASGHLHKVVSYYASIWPDEVWRLQRAARSLPDERSRATLLNSGVNCIVVHNIRQDEYTFLLKALTADGYPVKFAAYDSAVISIDGSR